MLTSDKNENNLAIKKNIANAIKSWFATVLSRERGGRASYDRCYQCNATVATC